MAPINSLRWRVAALGLIALAIGVWWLARKPILVHTHALGTADRACGAYYEQGTGVTILNPFRDRGPELQADVFLRAASKATCSPEMNESLCKFVIKRPLPATDWRLVYRSDAGKDVRLYYRLSGGKLGKDVGCVIAEIHLEQSGGAWKPCGYGVSW
jgi:hypothetical protein